MGVMALVQQGFSPPRLALVPGGAVAQIWRTRQQGEGAMAKVAEARRDPRQDAETAFYGIHHLALNTDDMKMTADFYVGVLGMRLVHAMKVPPGVGTGPGNRGNPPFEEIRHYFFDMGRDALLAFFEIPKGAKPQGDRDAIAMMQHVSFAVSPEAQRRIGERLDRAGVSYQGPIEVLPGVHSIYCFDPNGIRLEFSCRPGDGEGDPRIVGGQRQTKDEALRELQTLSGDRAWLDWVTRPLKD
jgi:catechol 2,3-dioxygenase-like lactoylglutathione lyase family enzyme